LRRWEKIEDEACGRWRLEAKKMNANKGLPEKFTCLKPKAKRSSNAEGYLRSKPSKFIPLNLFVFCLTGTNQMIITI
jgi:hypothetical protein